ncbi:uncharacterized protein LOC110859128 [Folsomia candida]|uniref:uncharacterized protein LOC110859128 n=1 Tax=Folsomia candida TaxID=158441 RepID=UPI000B8EE93E|nr:uncharacterized protein LOC110859128 [Folsomia candida]
MKPIMKLILGVFGAWLVVGIFVVFFLWVTNHGSRDETGKSVLDEISYREWEEDFMRGLTKVKMYDGNFNVIQVALVPGVCWGYEGFSVAGEVTISLLSPFILTGFTVQVGKKVVNLPDFGGGLSYQGQQGDEASFKFQVLGQNVADAADGVHDYGTYEYEDDVDEDMQYFKVMNFTTTQYPVIKVKILHEEIMDFFESNNNPIMEYNIDFLLQI